MYKINDLVQYQGNLEIFSNNFAKIIGFKNFNNAERVHLQSMHNKQNFWSDYNEIRHILLEEKHLINLGFKKDKTLGSLLKFTLNNIVVSSSISRYDNGNLFISGFVLGDVTVSIDFRRYLYENKVDSEKFYKDFPMMYTLSDLLGYFKENDIKFDEVEVSTL